MTWSQFLMYAEPVAAVLAAAGAIAGAALFIARAQGKIREQKLRDEIQELGKKGVMLESQVDTLRELLTQAKTAGQAALFLRMEIDEALRTTRLLLGAQAASILVPYPMSTRPELVFLSVDSPNANKLRKQRIPNRPGDPGIAVSVFHECRPHLALDAQSDKRFNSSVDKRAQFQTKSLLALPLEIEDKVIGVVEFLNKTDGVFSNDDIEAASRILQPLAEKVNSFVERTENFELLGLAAEKETIEGSVLIADLSNSTSMLEIYPTSLVIDMINEYLELMAQIGLENGATIDKFMGDSVILVFGLPRSPNRHAIASTQAAKKMQAEFDRLKSGWLSSGIPAIELFNRVAIASGQMLDADLGPAQHRQHTVIGCPIVVASDMCSKARRDTNVTLVDGKTYEAVSKIVKVHPLPLAEFGKACRFTSNIYEVIQWV